MWNVLKKKRRDLEKDKAAQKPESNRDKMEKFTVTRTVSEPPGGSAKGSYIGTDYDNVSVKAGDRKDRLDAETRAGKLGPFSGGDEEQVAPAPGQFRLGKSTYQLPKPKELEILDNIRGKSSFTGKSIVPRHPIAAESGGGSTMAPKDHAAAAEMHQRLSDLYGKYKKPAQDTIPHTTGLTPGEKSELGSDVDMEGPK